MADHSLQLVPVPGKEDKWTAVCTCRLWIKDKVTEARAKRLYTAHCNRVRKGKKA